MKIKKYKITNIAMTSPFLLAGMILAYTLIIGSWSVNRFKSYNATLWDMGIMGQAIWNTAHGRILHESINLGYSISRLAEAHWELIYLPLAIIYRIIPSIPLLLYIQSLVLACGVIPIYKFALRKLSSEPAALFISASYLFYPALHGANLFDLHGLTFATTFLLFTFYYLDKGKWIIAIIFAVLSICCREDVALVVFMLGIYTLFKSKTGDPIEKHIALKLRAIFISMSLLWIIAFFGRAYFIGQGELADTSSMISNWENSSAAPIFDFIKTLLSNNLKYIAKLTLPVIGLPLLSPSIMLIALPTLLLNISSNWPQMRQIEYHYTAAITPFIFLATIQGISNLKGWSNRFPKFQSNRIPIILSSIILLASIVSTTQFSILRFHKTWQVSASNKKLSRQLLAIPSDLSISATARVGAHLANRKELFHFPEHFSDADLIVLALNRPEVEIKNLTGKRRTNKVVAWNELTQSIFQDTSLGLRFIEDNVFCLQRGLASKTSFKELFFLEEIPSNGTSANKINVGNGLNLLGWKPVYIGNQQAHFQLFWSTDKPQPETTCLNFYLTSTDSAMEIPYKPILGRIPIHEWEPGKVVSDHLFVNRPKDTEARTYSVMLSTSTDNNSQRIHLFDFIFP